VPALEALADHAELRLAADAERDAPRHVVIEVILVLPVLRLDHRIVREDLPEVHVERGLFREAIICRQARVVDGAAHAVADIDDADAEMRAILEAQGIESLLAKNKIVRHRGTGRLAGPGKVEVTAADGGRTTLESRVDRLATLLFHKKLGSYRDKLARIERLAEAIARETLHADAATCRAAAQAARLAKTDLTTDMVREFTELQGTMGGIYAREEGQPEAVWKAIYWHYLPIGVEADAAPSKAQLGAAAATWAAVLVLEGT